MQHSDLAPTDSGLELVAEAQVSAEVIAAKAEDAIERHDYEKASQYLTMGGERFPEDVRVLRLRRSLGRLVRINTLIDEFREAGADNRFVQALGAFREAANLSQGLPGKEEALFELAVSQARGFTAGNWRVAAALLSEAGQLGYGKVPEALWEKIGDSERQETVANILAEAGRLEASGDWDQAGDCLVRAAAKYPSEQGLREKLAEVELARNNRQKRQERNAQLRRLAAQWDELDQAEEQEQAERLIARIGAGVKALRFDPEFAALLGPMEEQVQKGRLAATALAKNRLWECEEFCASILALRPKNVLFQQLKSAAEARTAVAKGDFETRVSHIRELWAEGELTESEIFCRAALERYPESADLQELAKAIQTKMDEAETLVEQANGYLANNDFDAAKGKFLEVFALLPRDRPLAEYVLEQLHGDARVSLTGDWRRSEALLTLAKAIQPASVAPEDVLAHIAGEKQREEETRRRSDDLKRLAEFKRQLGSARSKQKFVVLRNAVIETKLAASPDEEVAAAASDLIGEAEEQIESAREEHFLTPNILRMALLVLFGVAAFAIWMVTRPTAERAGLSKPETPAIDGGSAASGVKLPTAESTKIEPGAPAGTPTVEGQQLPADASGLSAEKQDWDRAASTGTPQALAEFMNRHPGSSYQPAAMAKLEDLEWRQTDKSDADSLRAFALKYPDGNHRADATAQLQSIARAKAVELAEQSAWETADKNNRSQLSAYLARYPAGNHADEAAKTIASLERAQADEATWASVNMRNRKSIENYMSQFPAGKYRAEAQGALEALRSAAAPAVALPNNTTVEADSTEVLTVLSRLTTAWNSKDLDGILKIQRNLDRQELKAQLSATKSISMRISPIGHPEISGLQATVTCKRQADQAFKDGSFKRNPELVVTYVLEKRDGAWTIEGARE